MLNVIYFGTSSGTGRRRVHVGERGQEASLGKEGRKKRGRKEESKQGRKDEKKK